MTVELLTELAKVKAMFQQRAIMAVINQGGENLSPTENQCKTCGDYDCDGGLLCITGDGV